MPNMRSQFCASAKEFDNKVVERRWGRVCTEDAVEGCGAEGVAEDLEAGGEDLMSEGEEIFEWERCGWVFYKLSASRSEMLIGDRKKLTFLSCSRASCSALIASEISPAMSFATSAAMPTILRCTVTAPWARDRIAVPVKQTLESASSNEERTMWPAGLRSTAVPCSEPYLDFARTGALVWDCMDECVVSYGSNIAGWYLHGRLSGGLGRGWVGDWSLCRCSAHSDLSHGLMFGANAEFFIFV